MDRGADHVSHQARPPDAQLFERLGFAFEDERLLETALTHPSHSYEADGSRGNERLEYLRARVDEAMREVHVPAGYALHVEHEAEDSNPLIWMLYLGLFLIYLVLAVAFESFTLPLIIFMTIPLALIGVLWALVMTGTNFELIVIMALLFLLGIVVNNGIILIDYAEYLKNNKGFSRVRAIIARVSVSSSTNKARLALLVFL